jgi:Circovirus replication-associated protein
MGKLNTRNICFTINNPSSNEIVFPESTTLYAIWQLEKGTAGTKHLQGYVEFSKPLSFKSIKGILGNSAHLEARRGTRDQARTYCRKEDTRVEGPWEFGEWRDKAQGNRTDVETIMESLREGKTELEIMEEHPNEWARNYRLIDRYNRLKPAKREYRTEFHVFIGDPGTGKSKAMLKNCPSGYWKPSGKWFDGYNGTDPLCLDEIDQQDLSIGLLLKMADRYPLRVEQKGGFIDFCPRVMYATSNAEVEEWFPKTSSASLRALMRRIDSITTFRWQEEDGKRYVIVSKQTFQVEIFDLDEITKVKEPILLTPPSTL